MPRKLNHAAASVWLLAAGCILPGSVFAAQPAVEDVMAVLGMDRGLIAELAQGQPVAYALNEGGADELAMGLAWYLPVPLDRMAGNLKLEYPDSLDVGVTANGVLTEHGGVESLAAVVLSSDEAQALLDIEPGDEFNLSADEIDSFKTLKYTLQRTPDKSLVDAVGQRYREILYRRFEAYRKGGANAIAPYAREQSLSSSPSLELRQAAAASSSAILTSYLPALHEVWLDYPKALPPGAVEAFPWVQKNVEGRPAVILRHRVHIEWNGGVLVLTREFYASHSYNSSQWITGFLPYRGGTVVFQQVRSFTDQVAGVASGVKHVVGRSMLKDKMLQSFERLCGVLGQCR